MAAWFAETLYPDLGQRFRIDKLIHRRTTAYHELVIFDNATVGRVLALDGIVQLTERDEFIYHEMLAHAPILAHGKARRVLIVGGGDGAMIEEVLKHRRIERAVLAEIDECVVELCRAHLPGVSKGAFEDPRLELVIADGARYVAESGERFDVIIVDSPDPIGPGAALFSARFYRDCRRRLAEGGILVAQNGVPFLQPDELRASRARLEESFADVSFYLAPVPTYYGGPMAFAWASEKAARRRISLAALRRRFAAAGLDTRCYSPEVHRAAFVLPPWLRALVAEPAPN